MEEKNNNKNLKWLVVLLMLIIIAALILTVYKLFIYDKKQIVPKEPETKEVTYEKIDFEVREIINDYESIKNLYVKGNKVEGIEASSLEIQQFKDLLIVEAIDLNPPKKLFVVDKDGNIIELNYMINADSNFKEEYNLYEIKDDKLVIQVSRKKEETNWYCLETNKEEVSRYNVEYKYLENNKFDDGKVVNKILVKEEYKDSVC